MFHTILNKLIQRIPQKKVLLQKPTLKWLTPILKNKKLWILKRKSVANALFIGMIAAFTPWPIQMLQASVMSVFFNANLPIAVATVWITNPITMGPMFYGAYKLGAFLLNVQANFSGFELSWHWLNSIFVQVWQPFLLGCFLTGLIFGSLLWLLSHFIWYRGVMKKWEQNHRPLSNKK